MAAPWPSEPQTSPIHECGLLPIPRRDLRCRRVRKTPVDVVGRDRMVVTQCLEAPDRIVGVARGRPVLHLRRHPVGGIVGVSPVPEGRTAAVLLGDIRQPARVVVTLDLRTDLGRPRAAIEPTLPRDHPPRIVTVGDLPARTPRTPTLRRHFPRRVVHLRRPAQRNEDRAKLSSFVSGISEDKPTRTNMAQTDDWQQTAVDRVFAQDDNVFK